MKIKLTDFTRAGALSPGESYFRSAIIDTANGSAYFGTYTGKIVKVRLSDFSCVGVLPLWGYEQINSAVIDTVNGFAYFGTYTGTVAKVRLPDLRGIPQQFGIPRKCYIKIEKGEYLCWMLGVI